MASSFSLALGSLQHYRDCAAREIGEGGDGLEHQSRSADPIVFPDVYIASSCLQKALRRSERDVALAAGRYLLSHDPQRLWRRLVGIAFEDLGLADLTVLARVVAVAGAKNLRLVAGENKSLAYVVALICATAKDRRLDHLHAIGQAVFEDRGLLARYDRLPLGAVLGPLLHEAAKLIGTCTRPIPGRGYRSASATASERALQRMAAQGRIGPGLLELCDRGVRLSGYLLPVLLPLALEATAQVGGLGAATDRVLAQCPAITGGVPAYAFDGFTRTGRTVLRRLVDDEPRLKLLLGNRPRQRQVDIAHQLLFFAEGCLCSPEIDDPLVAALRTAEIALGIGHDEVEPALALMHEILPRVHDLRRAATRSFPTKQEVLP